MNEIRYLLFGLILHLIVISESRVIVPRDLSDDRLSIDEGMPILLNPLDKDKKPPISNPPKEDDDYNLDDYEGVNDHHSPPFYSDYNESDRDINKVDNNLPEAKPERFPFDANDEELEGKDNRDKPSDDDLKKKFGNEDSDNFGNNDKDLESSLDEDKPILKNDDEEIGDNDATEPDEDYGDKEHNPENEEKPGEERKDDEENPEPEDEEKPDDEKKDEDEEHKPEDKEKPDENNEDEDEDYKPEDKEKPDEDNEDEEKNQEPEDVEKPDEEKKDEEELESDEEEKIDETKGGDDDDDNEEEKNVPNEPIDDENKEEEIAKGIDEESLDKEDDNNMDKGIHEGEEAGFLGGGSIFDTPFFNVEQVKKYFSKLDRALGHVFRQTLDEAYLLNGTYANTTEEEVEIDGKKYIVTKSVIKGSDNHSSLYVESLSTKGNDTEIIKDIEIRNVSHT